MAEAKKRKKEKVPLTFFEREAREFLRMEFHRRDISYKQLSKDFKRLGETVPASTLSNKVNRGKFAAAFIFQCMHAANIRDLRLNPAPTSADELEAIRATAKKATRRKQPKKVSTTGATSSGRTPHR